MDQILELLSTELVRSGIRMGTPLILAAIGGALCNRAGVLNFALEAKLLLGAFVGIMAGFAFGNSYIGVLVAGVAGGLVGALIAFLYLRYRVNLIVLALAIIMFVEDITVFLMRTFLGSVASWSDPSVQQLPDIAIPVVDGIPILGDILSGYNIIVYLSWLSAIAAFILLFHTKLGRHIRAVGENQEAAEAAGINTGRVKTIVLLVAGVLCGIGGAFLSLGHLTLFTRNMSNGRGFIAFTAALFGLNHPLWVFLAALFFGMTDALAIGLQTTTDVPPSVVQFIPHALTLLTLAVVGARAVIAERIARRAFRLRHGKSIAS
jgi:simple sugar transport system permease protein